VYEELTQLNNQCTGICERGSQSRKIVEVCKHYDYTVLVEVREGERKAKDRHHIYSNLNMNKIELTVANKIQVKSWEPAGVVTCP
jgi:hypothetical protein